MSTPDQFRTGTPTSNHKLQTEVAQPSDAIPSRDSPVTSIAAVDDQGTRTTSVGPGGIAAEVSYQSVAYRLNASPVAAAAPPNFATDAGTDLPLGLHAASAGEPAGATQAASATTNEIHRGVPVVPEPALGAPTGSDAIHTRAAVARESGAFRTDRLEGNDQARVALPPDTLAAPDNAQIIAETFTAFVEDNAAVASAQQTIPVSERAVPPAAREIDAEPSLPEPLVAPTTFYAPPEKAATKLAQTALSTAVTPNIDLPANQTKTVPPHNTLPEEVEIITHILSNELVSGAPSSSHPLYPTGQVIYLTAERGEEVWGKGEAHVVTTSNDIDITEPDTYAKLTHLEVSLDKRNHNIGSTLLSNLEQQARAAGATRVEGELTHADLMRAPGMPEFLANKGYTLIRDHQGFTLRKPLDEIQPQGEIIDPHKVQLESQQDGHGEYLVKIRSRAKIVSHDEYYRQVEMFELPFADIGSVSYRFEGRTDEGVFINADNMRHGWDNDFTHLIDILITEKAEELWLTKGLSPTDVEGHTAAHHQAVKAAVEMAHNGGLLDDLLTLRRKQLHTFAEQGNPQALDELTLYETAAEQAKIADLPQVDDGNVPKAGTGEPPPPHEGRTDFADDEPEGEDLLKDILRRYNEEVRDALQRDSRDFTMIGHNATARYHNYLRTTPLPEAELTAYADQVAMVNTKCERLLGYLPVVHWDSDTDEPDLSAPVALGVETIVADTGQLEQKIIAAQLRKEHATTDSWQVAIYAFDNLDAIVSKPTALNSRLLGYASLDFQYGPLEQTFITNFSNLIDLVAERAHVNLDTPPPPREQKSPREKEREEIPEEYFALAQERLTELLANHEPNSPWAAAFRAQFAIQAAIAIQRSVNQQHRNYTPEENAAITKFTKQITNSIRDMLYSRDEASIGEFVTGMSAANSLFSLYLLSIPYSHVHQESTLQKVISIMHQDLAAQIASQVENDQEEPYSMKEVLRINHEAARAMTLEQAREILHSFVKIPESAITSLRQSVQIGQYTMDEVRQAAQRVSMELIERNLLADRDKFPKDGSDERGRAGIFFKDGYVELYYDAEYVDPAPVEGEKDFLLIRFPFAEPDSPTNMASFRYDDFVVDQSYDYGLRKKITADYFKRCASIDDLRTVIRGEQTVVTALLALDSGRDISAPGQFIFPEDLDQPQTDVESGDPLWESRTLLQATVENPELSFVASKNVFHIGGYPIDTLLRAAMTTAKSYIDPSELDGIPPKEQEITLLQVVGDYQIALQVKNDYCAVFINDISSPPYIPPTKPDQPQREGSRIDLLRNTLLAFEVLLHWENLEDLGPLLNR